MIYDVPFAVYERLASAKMNALEAAINAHTHDGLSGAKVQFQYLDGLLLASQIPNNLITGAMIGNDTITSAHIVNNTITINDVDHDPAHASSLKLDSNGYAFYA